MGGRLTVTSRQHPVHAWFALREQQGKGKQHGEVVTPDLEARIPQ